MPSIKIKNNNKFDTYFELSLEIVVPIPLSLQSIDNKQNITDSYKSMYGIDKIVGNDMYFDKIQSFQNDVEMQEVEQVLNDILAKYEQDFSQFQLQPIDEFTGKTWVNGAWEFITT
jgi:hypothetical protein